ncbi:gluconate 2-dehydrogenase subunit 3 family protein [Polaribacter sp.]|uniref:gluconate 2-dehydrogenase subunit 3 family protein n=1 Tax=Polaribacter sp. TaxID=1920175 RepID=UPI003F6CD38F
MDRRKAIGGILAITGISFASYKGIRFFYGTSNRGKLNDHKSLIAELVDVIIPPTDTPGAKEANVQDYIIDFMEACSSNKEFNTFFNGLSDLQETTLSDYDTTFENCTITQKTALLKNLDTNSDPNSILTKIDTKIRGRSFFKILKTLTVEGYCTSEIGATQMLAYDRAPGKYIAITTLQPNQKAWATR